MNNKIKELSKNISLFAISSLIPKILTFLLIPIYTRYLNPSDYDYADLINTTSLLLVPIFTIDIQDAVMRFAMNKKYEKKDIFSMALLLNIIGAILVISLCLIGYKINLFNLPNYFFPFLFIYYFFTALNNLVTLFCKGIEKVKCIVVGSIIHSAIMLLLNILFVVYLHGNVIYYLIANSLGAFCQIVYTFFSAKIYKYINFKLNILILKKMIIYSFPLVFSVVSWWINNASDRYILTWLSGAYIGGLYAMSYKIPNILSTVQSIFFNAWSISSIKEFDKSDKDGFIGNMYSLMNYCMCIFCSLIMIFNILIAKILYAGEFIEAWKFVPPLLISVVFNAMGLFLGGIYTAVMDTKTLSISTIIGAIINTILNIILIPKFNGYGAGIATLIGYFIIFIIRKVKIKKYIHLKEINSNNYILYIILIFQMVFAFMGNKYVLIQLVCLATIIYLTRKEIMITIKFFKKVLKKRLKNEKN